MIYKSIEEAQNVLTAFDELYDKTDEIIKALMHGYDNFYIENVNIKSETTHVSYNDYYDPLNAEFPSKYYTMEQEDIIKDIEIREELERKKKEEEIAKFEAANRKREYEAEYQKYLELKEKFEGVI